ncbi:calcium homeostasis modulator protein 2 [Anolis carolinensis]|uniref:Calcium homeostasis modulator family member 2 n=1 Tax=Anolis carolinensis TaxID=28377 RepID=G1KDA3_ANOCA|nr:PREDICTED: calcium homeostasis modulator protein 2 [Anolis carolinensis]XP_008104792.1 PREDICTED: calcium homeostasis modulator protein 2 [Anolis carolinensis]XP_008104793.1 PREDICTED: calcium homeostasis modulator protein 2 [Anolis carolinensis]XP_008104794.1 PREDICTED: calcium homeostasis modulator protein 2 [Anolis carolinensis]XP_008104795.1 PREDICTED: calcium homeostasis modulator protein 2 [Anolis carolinensis]XP_016847658.1 PREDICTED: calcium homeostasis modulator protein 2 [Anolis c|eukprot:XP_003218537.1 PREDICTED: calcium homeostasis modulator protein 2 [Anolis carolinensis]
MAALIAENFRFLSLFFKSKDVMIFNGLVALGTVGSQELFSVVAFHCPCSPARNYIYGLAAIGVPALALFVLGVIWNHHTWNLVAECHKRGTKNFSAAANFLIFGSVMGRAAVAPITWSVISLLRGDAYVCALSEFMDPTSLNDFPSGYGADTMAKFPCDDFPKNVTGFKDEVIRRLKYESQLFGWMLIGVVAVLVFITKCLKHCCSPLSYRQEAYWDQYRSNETRLFQRTAEVHAKIMAANNVKNFFGFVYLNKEEAEEMEKFVVSCVQPRQQWDAITGVYIYRENNGIPLYSRLHKWAKRLTGNSLGPDSQETAFLAT